METQITQFNVRVYGILINSKNQVLLSNEKKGEFEFVKFPGGGLQFGEGIEDCLIREFREETGIHIKVKAHFYTTDFFQRSAFNARDQLISIYYLVESKDSESIANNQKGLDEADQFFTWINLEKLKEEDLTFPIDQTVAKLLIKS